MEDLSRYVLAATCFGSAVAAIFVAVNGAHLYRWLMVFTAHWSVWFAAGMLVLAVDLIAFVGDPLFVAGLNSSASATVGGWTAAAAINYRRSRRALSRAQSLVEGVTSG